MNITQFSCNAWYKISVPSSSSLLHRELTVVRFYEKSIENQLEIIYQIYLIVLTRVSQRSLTWCVHFTQGKIHDIKCLYRIWRVGLKVYEKLIITLLEFKAFARYSTPVSLIVLSRRINSVSVCWILDKKAIHVKNKTHCIFTQNISKILSS